MMDFFDQNISIRREYITVSGIVQGVGFRPYVFRLAEECGLTGSVCNTGQGVVIDVQGGERIEEFIRRLPIEAPPLALITDLTTESRSPGTDKAFVIIESVGATATTALIPADVALCRDCQRELLDLTDRRYRYPFINCTNCGPRYTITASIPYDRPQTSMRDFPMCKPCADEYHDPHDRRFHAQPNACHVCGPRLRYTTGGVGAEDVFAVEAFDAAVAALRTSRIVAIRGLGGYHLAVDARSDAAVTELRRRKRRFEKPLAVMVRDLVEAEIHCEFSDLEAATLMSPQRPVVILPRKTGSGIAEAVSLNNPTLGVMLPYTPLHVLLMEILPALVMTSANLSEEPICTDEDEAEERLSCIADGFLHHNRDILQRCDDSVVRVIAGEVRPVRRSRGYVPRPILFREEGPSILATGAELKNTFCLTLGRSAILSQHIGDLENLETLQFFEEAVSHLLSVFDVTPTAIAHDMHPGYLGTQWARKPVSPTLRKRFKNTPRISIQHHHAHFASCLAEHDHNEPAIGIILDGTGYGTDSSSWGGEFLAGTIGQVERVGHFQTLPMPGADAAIREPWRMAWSAMTEAGLDPEQALPVFALRRNESEREAVRFALSTHINTPSTSGCGRLFDAVAALAGIGDVASFEAQVAIALEHAAGGRIGVPYGFDLVQCGPEMTPIQLSFLPAIRDIVQDVRSGANPAEISRRFHATVVEGCIAIVRRLSNSLGLTTIVLSGGVFQNALLLERMIERLRAHSFTVLSHRQIPANDAGISLGQAAVARTIFQG